ncbi:hypothetical protein N9X42_03960 [Candidatus Pelagibacter bacterium]|nr:hypothetical protein [Candidatus Pelagibacter bacterium]
MIAKLNFLNNIFFLRFFLIIIIFFFSQSFKSSATTPDTFLNLEEIDQLTKSVIAINQDSIDQSLEYLFKKNKSEKAIFGTSQRKIVNIFVTEKNKLDKYPYKTIIGMAYFEFFYAEQVKENKKRIRKFKDTYPKINKSTKKAVKNLYNLNDVRKKMRESIGLTLETAPKDVIKNYIILSKYLKNSEPKKIKLNEIEKKVNVYSQKITKFLSLYEKNIILKKQNRITEKIFLKNIKKNYKSLTIFNRKIEKLSGVEDKAVFLQILSENIYEIISTTHNNLISDSIEYNVALDSLYFANSLIKQTKAKIIKNNYEQIWPVDFKAEDSLDENELVKLAEINRKTTKIKFLNNNKLQSSTLNLINEGNYNINLIIDDIQNKFKIQVDAIKLNYATIDEMKNWNKSDWAKSWKGSLAKDLYDAEGNLVNFSNQNIEDLRALLALNNFNTLMDNTELNNLDIEIQDIQNSIQDIKNVNISRILNQDFSITLDNYSKILAEDAINRFGDQFDAQTIQEIRDNANFESLTTITNMEYGTNMTSAEYRSYWENAQYMNSTSTWGDVTRGVDLISNLSSFDAAAAAKELGADLQTVADSIAQAASVGISTDLEAAAKGLGYDSFSDAVSAYNAEHGTNYTDAEAKEALGQ